MSRLTAVFFVMSLFPLAMPLAAPEPRSLMGEIPTIDYCNLIHNPNTYREKVIRIHAKYRIGAKWSNLYSPYCGGPSEIWVNFDETYFNESFQPCQKSNIAEKVKFKGFDQIFDVVLVGKFYGSGEPNYGNNRSRFMFVVGCVEQATVVENSETMVPTVIYCDLVQNASRYNEKVVRVQGVYSSGFEASYLRGSECEKELTWVEFDELYKTCTSKEVDEALDNLMRLSNQESLMESKRASVVFLGYFEVSPTYRLVNDYPRDGFGHRGGYKNQFTVKCIEQAAALPANRPQVAKPEAHEALVRTVQIIGQKPLSPDSFMNRMRPPQRWPQDLTEKPKANFTNYRSRYQVNAHINMSDESKDTPRFPRAPSHLRTDCLLRLIR